MTDAKHEDENAPAPLSASDYVLFERGNQHLYIDSRRKRRWPPFLLIGVLSSGMVALAYAERQLLSHLSVTLIATVQGFDLVTYLIISAVSTIVALWIVPKWQARRLLDLTAAERFDKENEARKTLAQLVVGLVFFASLYSATKTFEVTRDGQITDRFTKAIAQLDSKNSIESRLGGIYALERIAQESERDHWPIMEILTAYVRQHAPSTSEKASEPNAQVRPQTDIQAVLTVISRRSAERVIFEEKTRRSLDLARTDLRGGYLRKARLQHANLEDAQLQHADLEDAQLQNANLSGAQLQKAILSASQLQDAHLLGAGLQDAILSSADLRGAILSEAMLQGAYIERTKLQGANLFQAKLNHATLTSADLQGTILEGAEGLTQAQLDLTNCDESTVLPHGLTCKSVSGSSSRPAQSAPATPQRRRK